MYFYVKSEIKRTQNQTCPIIPLPQTDLCCRSNASLMPSVSDSLAKSIPQKLSLPLSGGDS